MAPCWLDDGFSSRLVTVFNYPSDERISVYAPVCSLQVIKQYLIFMVNTASCNYSSHNDLVLISSK